MPNTSPLKDACDQVIGKMDGIITSQEIVSAVLKIFPSKAKNPTSGVLTALRGRGDVISLDDGRWGRADFLSDGAKFRIRITGDNLALGVAKPQWFMPFDAFVHPIESRFIDDRGEEIPVVKKHLHLHKLDNEQLLAWIEMVHDSMPLLEMDEQLSAEVDLEFDESMDDESNLAKALDLLREKLKTASGKEVTLHDMTDFFLRHQAEAGDFLIVTVRPRENSYIFEFEPANMANTALIEKRDVEVRNYIRRAVIDKTRVYADQIILAAYHKFQ